MRRRLERRREREDEEGGGHDLDDAGGRSGRTGVRMLRHGKQQHLHRKTTPVCTIAVRGQARCRVILLGAALLDRQTEMYQLQSEGDCILEVKYSYIIIYYLFECYTVILIGVCILL